MYGRTVLQNVTRTCSIGLCTVNSFMLIDFGGTIGTITAMLYVYELNSDWTGRLQPISFITPPRYRGAEYCDQPVCLCVCLSVREHISGTAGPIFTKFCVHILYGCGSFLLRQRCATLCTSGFMDDVTFGCSAWAVWACTDWASRSIGHLAAPRDHGGVWCRWMPY